MLAEGDIENYTLDASSDDELDWEEVDVPVQTLDLEITIQTAPKAKEAPAKCV
jgi:hypothetical protein